MTMRMRARSSVAKAPHMSEVVRSNRKDSLNHEKPVPNSINRK